MQRRKHEARDHDSSGEENLFQRKAGILK